MSAKACVVCLIFAGLWLLGAWTLPVIQDEAYYFGWANHLQLGYFDHPPFVALMSWPATFAHANALIARAGTLLTAYATLWAAARFFRVVGLRSPAAQTLALILTFGNLMGLAFGFIATPDTGLMLAWVLALSEAALALQDDDRHWLNVGIVTGCGLWAKYMMLLIGPVLLWALFAQRRRFPDSRRGLRTPWPYLGGVLALAIWLPHLAWNAEHDWITLRFQLRHGFAKEHLSIGSDSILPSPEPAVRDSAEWLLAQPFVGLKEEEAKTERAPRAYDPLLKALNGYFGYYGSQVGAWGALAFAIGSMLWQRRQRRRRGLDPAQATPLEPAAPLSAAVAPLVAASAVVPLLVFGVLAIATHVEANWSAMYLFGAAAWLTPRLLTKQKSVMIGWSVNILLLLILLTHAATGLLPTRPHRDRLLAETHGYAELAGQLAKLSDPIFADTYQITAMVNFYLGVPRLRQWPGITRDSEYIRTLREAPVTTADLTTAGGFWLVTSDMPPNFAGFRGSAMTELRDCKGAPLQVISTLAANGTTSLCKQAIHEWYLVRYDAQPNASL